MPKTNFNAALKFVVVVLNDWQGCQNGIDRRLTDVHGDVVKKVLA